MANTQRTTMVAAFADRLEAEKAVDELEQAGFDAENVGYAIRGNDVGAGGMITDEEGAKDRPGALAGMAAGAGVGALLGAAAALLIPGVGPFIAAGPIMGALAGVGVGGAVGGLIGALVGMGIPEYEAKRYEGRVKEGGILLSAHCDTSEEITRAKDILKLTGAEDIASSGESSADSAKTARPSRL